MSKDVIVVMHATHRAHLMDEYEGQLRDAGIDHHVEPVTLPDGINSMTIEWRLNFWERMCQQFSGYERIVFTDAWDVLFYGTKDALLPKIPNVLISAERNCWPDETLAVKYRNDSPWRFPNPGCMAGYPDVIVTWVDIIRRLAFPDMQEMDQLWFCKRSIDHPILVPLDTKTTMFYVASQDQEDKSLTLSEDLGLYNMRFGTYPQFVHFAGPCHPDPFRAMLRGEVDAL